MSHSNPGCDRQDTLTGVRHGDKADSAFKVKRSFEGGRILTEDNHILPVAPLEALLSDATQGRRQVDQDHFVKVLDREKLVHLLNVPA